jgi:hypothetical protein
MPRLTTLISLFIAVILCGSLFAANTQPTIQSINKMPLSFTKNMGQWDDRVLFRANSGGATMWFTKEGVTYQFTRRVPSPPSPLPTGEGWLKAGERAVPFDRFDNTRDSIEQLVLTAKFIGANPNPEVFAEGQMEYKCNYFLGNDPAKWYTDVPNYEAITLKDIYPGIDLKYCSGDNGQAAYEFIAAPGADIAKVKVEYDGAEETSLDSDGKLILKTKWGDMTAAIGSGINGIGLASPRFALNSENTLDFAASGQNLGQVKSGTLALAYSTYLGGGSSDIGTDIAVDASGNVYVAGVTSSSDFPTLNPYQTHQDSSYNGDVSVTKLSSSGSLIYSTYLGGDVNEIGYGIAVDGTCNVYVTGWTNSSDFPTWNPYQGNQDSTDVFVTRISSSGNSLIYSTYLGGGGIDVGNDIAADGSGSAYITGYTWSSDFPTINPYQTNQGYRTFDAFVTKIPCSGGSPIYSTYLGGGDLDEGRGIAVDGSGNAYVTGITFSSDFPTLNAYQTYQGAHGWGDVFITKLFNSGDSLVYSTYLGGRKGELGEAITVDNSGSAYVAGTTSSLEFPTLNPYQTWPGDSYNNAFVTKLSNTGSDLIYSTYLGGGGIDYVWDIAVDGSGDAFVTGYTSSRDFPIQNAYQVNQDTTDAFVTEFSGSGSSLIYSTYLGGTMEDDGYGLAIDVSGNAYITGLTFSSNFPTNNPFEATYHIGGGDAFVTKLAWTLNYVCGDVNTDEQVNLLDAVFLINYIFVGGPAPQQLSLADVNCSGSINIADVVLMINYIFRGGPAPCAECE